jgi:hypothetical protein
MKDSYQSERLPNFMIPTCSLQHGPHRPAKALHQLICIALVAVAAGCSSVKNHVDKGPIQARTFSFLDAGSRQLPAYAEDRAQAHAMIQEAITKNLASKGVTKLPAGGDVNVAYLLIVGNNAETTSLNEYFGYTDESAALVDEVHKEQTVKSKERGYFEAGTLVIDVLDPKTSKLLQRRSIQAQVLRNLPAENRAARVQSIVDQELAGLPVSP